MAQMGPLAMSRHRISVVALAFLALVTRKGRTLNEAVEERLALQILVVLLEVLLGRGDQLDGAELVAATRLVDEVPE